MTSRPIHIKGIVLGDGSVGKTCMLLSYMKNQFPEGYQPTVFDNHSATMALSDGRKVEFELFDTAGQEEYSKMRQLSYPQTDVFLICFSVMNSQSLENASLHWAAEVHEHAPGTPIVLVGLKTDLRADKQALAQLQEVGLETVPYPRGAAVAKEIGAAKYLECSALLQHGLKDVFDVSANVALSHREKKAKAASGGKQGKGRSKGCLVC